MKLLLLDTRNDKHYTGDTRADLIAAMVADGVLSINQTETISKAGIYPTKNTIATAAVKGYSTPIILGFTDEFSVDELTKEINRGVIEQLCRSYGFKVYKDAA